MQIPEALSVPRLSRVHSHHGHLTWWLLTPQLILGMSGNIPTFLSLPASPPQRSSFNQLDEACLAFVNEAMAVCLMRWRRHRCLCLSIYWDMSWYKLANPCGSSQHITMCCCFYRCLFGDRRSCDYLFEWKRVSGGCAVSSGEQGDWRCVSCYRRRTCQSALRPQVFEWKMFSGSRST